MIAPNKLTLFFDVKIGDFEQHNLSRCSPNQYNKRYSKCNYSYISQNMLQPKNSINPTD
jgi:hypothetical protein